MEKVIIDTDAGGDPDDTLAIALACKLPNVLAFVTSDETPDGRRAKLVRAIVGDRAPVLTGLPSPNPGKHILGRLHLSDSLEPLLMSDVLPGLIQETVQDADIAWVGIGSYTNLAWLHQKHPEFTESMRVVLMGGRMNYKEGDRPEHNFKIDPDAALRVATEFPRLTYVPATTTMHEATRVDATHPLVDYLSSGREAWQVAALENFNVWFEERFNSSYQHDALTLAVALGAIRNVALTRVRVIREGALIEDPASRVEAVKGSVDYEAFWQWVWNTLEPSLAIKQKDQS